MTPLPMVIAPVVATAAALAYLVWTKPRAAAPFAILATTGLAGLCAAAALRVGPGWWLPGAVLVLGHFGRLRRGRPGHADPPAASNTLLRSDPDNGADRATLGRYRIDRELGRGAMGAVYLAHTFESGPPVAIKTLALRRAFDADALADARERFFREADTARSLRHPDIVTVVEAGEDDGLAYLVMDFVPGTSLLAHTRPGTLLPVPVVVEVVARVALALAHAHAHGVVHRDVKPANVMFDPVTGSVKVTDFGIATLGDALRTRTGVLLGTPHFMSPEQLAGRRADGRSDLYALGVTLFQLLTGALPHRAESMGALLQQIAQEAAPDVRSLRPALSGALADVVRTALQKHPPSRHAGGRQLADALRASQAPCTDDGPGRPSTFHHNFDKLPGP